MEYVRFRPISQIYPRSSVKQTDRCYFIVPICQVHGYLQSHQFQTNCQQFITQIEQKFPIFLIYPLKVRCIIFKKRSLSISSLQTSPVVYLPGLTSVDPKISNWLMMSPLLHRYGKRIHLVCRQNVAAISVTLFLEMLLSLESNIAELHYTRQIIQAGQVMQLDKQTGRIVLNRIQR